MHVTESITEPYSLVRSGHARLLQETATALLEGGSTGQCSVTEACLLLATRSGGGAKVDDACFIAEVESKMGAPLSVRTCLNLDALYYRDVADLRPLLAVHEQHNRHRLLEHGLADEVPQALVEALSASAVPGVTSSPSLAGNATTHPASTSVMAAATRHGPIVAHGAVHLGLEVSVPASEFKVADGSAYAAVVSAMHSNGRTVRDLKTAGPICQLRFIVDRKRFWFTVERVTVFARGSTQPPSPVAPDSEERQMHTPPERTPEARGSNERRASPVRRRDPRRSRRL